MIVWLCWLVALLALVGSPTGFFFCCCGGALTLQCRTIPGLQCPVAGVDLEIKSGSTSLWTGTSDASGNAVVPAGTLASGSYSIYASKSGFVVRGGSPFTYGFGGVAETKVISLRPVTVSWSSSDGTATLTSSNYDNDAVTYAGRLATTQPDVVHATLCENGGVTYCSGGAVSGGVVLSLAFNSRDSTTQTSVSAQWYLTHCVAPGSDTYHFAPTSLSGGAVVADDGCAVGSPTKGSTTQNGGKSPTSCLPQTYTLAAPTFTAGVANPTVSYP